MAKTCRRLVDPDISKLSLQSQSQIQRAECCCWQPRSSNISPKEESS